ncbi:quinolinate synthase, chloroplastic [Silene latifolia]|uniref:quinolinate synthase, chloroplastic n=1 Tax=Silene latifolia TaxID=37657 RepID=UPI003D781CE5
MYSPSISLKPFTKTTTTTTTTTTKTSYFKHFKPIASTSIPITPSPSSSSSSSSSSTSLKLSKLISEFQPLTTPIDRLTRVLDYATILTSPSSIRTRSNRVMGCTAQVWLDAHLDGDSVRFTADSDSEVTRGLCGCLVWLLDGATPEQVLSVTVDDLAELNVNGVVNGLSSRSRGNTWHNVLLAMHKKTKLLLLEKQGGGVGEEFPSLVISEGGISAHGSFAQAQARYLNPNQSQVNELVNLLKEKNTGIVAHFYMDPEVQGVLTAAQQSWPHIYISDSLVMADKAVKMAEAGCQNIAVLGVDFMSENVRAILDQAGHDKVGVYRMSDERIGCSLADAASTPEYLKYLEDASLAPPSLHVVYINTSLETKALAHELVPTITCTSSNVVQTILQAFAQVPDLKVYYGPDSYMGANIAELFQQMTMMTDEEISAVHPQHNRESIKSLLPRLHYYQDGTCMVHDMFGQEVVDKINEMYCDAFLTAHFEVPGEMFSLAMKAKRRGMGVVGSTKNILDFITERLQESLDRNVDDHLQFILGTESGMITAIVAAVRKMLTSEKNTSQKADIKVEIVFPVSSDSVTNTKKSSRDSSNSAGVDDSLNLTVVPGVTSGEGCSIHGGCASCPYMKMNSLSALLRICKTIPDEGHMLSAYKAARFSSQMVSGRSVADVGCEPVLHMRHFQANRRLPEKLIHQICHSTVNN